MIHRKVALDSFRKSPFFQTWDPKALEAYVQYGIAEDPTTGKVRLKTSGYQVGYYESCEINIEYPAGSRGICSAPVAQ
jgi:hypothetical protein